MSEEQPAIKRIDHIIIRCDGAVQRQLFSLLSETFRLPIAWTIGTYPQYNSGGIFAGNINLELLQIDPQANPSTQASLFGLAFEPYEMETCLAELRRRGIPATPPTPYIQSNDEGEQFTLWTNAFLSKLLNNNPVTNTMLLLGQALPQRLLQRLSSTDFLNSPQAMQALQRVFPNGLFLLVKYNQEVLHAAENLAANTTVLRARQGGPLSVTGVEEVTIGVTDFPGAVAQWQKLLAPREEERSGYWQIEQGPAIRLTHHDDNRLLGMRWHVRSLAQAQQFLNAQGLLGSVSEREVSIAPDKLYGLDIRLQA